MKATGKWQVDSQLVYDEQGRLVCRCKTLGDVARIVVSVNEWKGKAWPDSPRYCTEEKVSFQTIVFCDLPICLMAISKKTGIPHSTLSRIFSGARGCSLRKAMAISEALGMDLTVFAKRLMEHTK